MAEKENEVGERPQLADEEIPGEFENLEEVSDRPNDIFKTSSNKFHYILRWKSCCALLK